MRKVKANYEETSLEEIQKQITRLQNRIDNLYLDKLDGKINQEFWQEKHNLWHGEKDGLIEKLKSISHATNETLNELSKKMEDSDTKGKNQIALKKSKRTIKVNGENIKLDNKQYSKYQQEYGRLSINACDI